MKNYFGFGFGPIQSGLMLYEAMKSGNFGGYVIAEVDPSLVDAVRRNDNSVTINIAKPDRIEQVKLDGIILANPGDPRDRRFIIDAIRDADEMATAIPSVSHYTAGHEQSIAALLANGVNAGKPQIVYASENNNHAAEILLREVSRLAPEEKLKNLQVLNTVIGKMSGVKTSRHDIEALGLAPMVPGAEKAVLVEEFNRILVSRVRPPAQKGIFVFEEKEDLLPFEEAKLYGHNAIHSMLGYLAHERGYRVMSQIRNDVRLYALAREAFLSESGAALIAEYGTTGDPLFTRAGFAAYAEDLLVRMTNPFLDDDLLRVCRDPARKLGYGDRLFGAMRKALRHGITPRLLAKGARAGLRYLAGQNGNGGMPSAVAAVSAAGIRDTLLFLWRNDEADEYRDICVELVAQADTAIGP